MNSRASKIKFQFIFIFDHFVVENTKKNIGRGGEMIIRNFAMEAKEKSL